MTRGPKLPEQELDALQAVQKHVELGDTALYAYQVEAGSGPDTCHVAAAPHVRDPSLHVIFTLGSLSPHVLITVTDGEPQAIARVLADLEAYDVPPRLGHGHTAPIESSYLNEHGRVGVVLLRPAVSNALAHVPDELVAGRRRLHCLLVLFLSEEELALKRAEGLDELLDYFEDIGRDVIAIQA